MPVWETIVRWIGDIGQGHEIFGNTIGRWLIAAAVFVLAWLVLRIVQVVLARRLKAFAQKTRTLWDDLAADLLGRTRSWFLLLLAVYAASLPLTLPEEVTPVIVSVTIIAVLLQAALWGSRLLETLISQYVEHRMATDAAAVTTMSALGFLGKLALWSVVTLLALDNIGMDVTAFIAGLGVGGIAVALAAQNILGDLFASLSIVLDKPFQLGDFIAVDDYLGTVEYIGLKTTRVQSLSGEQIVFSNGDLLKSRIRNFKQMQQRRVVFTIGVTYQTPHQKLAGIPGMIREAIESQERTRFDRAHFSKYGDFALIFEAVYYMLVPDYNAYMDTQQAVNLDLFRRFEAAQIEFAYPTQTLFLHQQPA